MRMASGSNDGSPDIGNVIDLTWYLCMVARTLYCRDCGYEDRRQLPIDYRAGQVVCRGCQCEGLVVFD